MLTNSVTALRVDPCVQSSFVTSHQSARLLNSHRGASPSVCRLRRPVSVFLAVNLVLSTHCSMRGLTPYLQVKKTDAAIAWYERVLGAKEVHKRLVAPDGACMNAQVEIEGSRMMIADANPRVGSQSPETLQATTAVMNLHVSDADATFAKALEAGAEEIYPLADQFYGDRAGRLRDPFGHHWIIATKLREVPEAEMLAAFDAMFQK